MSARLVIAAGTVHTMTGAPAQVVVIDDGRVVALGSRAELDALRRPADRFHDLGPATVVPGLIDAHAHPVLGTALTRGLGLTQVRSGDELTRLLRAQPGDDWILGWGLDPNIFETAADAAYLEDAVPGRAVVLRFFDAHAVIASREALRRAGITGPMSFGSAAAVACDADGTPTGLLLEAAAIAVVERAIPPLDPAEAGEALLTTLRMMSANGITTAHVLDLTAGSIEVLRSIEEAGELPIRLLMAPVCEPGSDRIELERLVSLQGVGGRRWRIDGVKFYADGTIDNGTAWLRGPDRDGASVTPYWADLEAFDAAQRFMIERGIPTRTHAIGDAAIEHTVATLERSASGSSVVHRLEHLEYLPPDLVGRLARAGVAAGMQPLHCTEFTTADRTDNWSLRLGHDRAVDGWPLAAVRAAGATLALGSDWPIASADTRAIMSSARSRRPVGFAGDAIRPEQGLTALEALEGLTTHAADSVGDTAGGRLAVGGPGDLTVFSVDPLTADPDELLASSILLTVVGGRVEHAA